MIGVTSVTFRQLAAEEVIALARQASLDGIEWGGDVHVPPGDATLARRIGKLTAAAGLQVLSYGSYYRLLANKDPAAAFAPVLETAVALGAPMVRIWAGSLSPKDATSAVYEAAAQELQLLCALAGEKGIDISTEYHRGTLTENADSARLLMQASGRANLHSYWQPNPDISPQANLAQLHQVLPWLSHVHVFHWKGANLRYPLAQGEADWLPYLAQAAGHACHYILEFVQDDSPASFLRDAATLKGWLKKDV